MIVKKLLAGLMALALLAAACGDDDGDSTDAGDETTETSETTESSETTVTTAATTEATEAEAPADDGAEPADGETDDDSAGDDSADDEALPATGSGEIGPFLELVLLELGVEVDDELIACIEEKGIDPNLDLNATEDDINAATVSLFGCAPDELASVTAVDIEPPDGTTAEDVECVLTEAFKILGNLPQEEALALLENDGDEIPDELRDEAAPAAASACGLDDDQIDAIFDS